MSDTITVNTSTTNITLSVFSQPNNINVNVVEAGAIWGSIVGTLSAQTDLYNSIRVHNVGAYDINVPGYGIFPVAGFNTSSGNYSDIGGGTNNIASGNYSHIGSGSCNIVSGNNSTISGGYNNTASGNYSAVVGGVANNTQFDNTFILGSNLSATAANFTYVNNLSTPGSVYAGTYYGDGSHLIGASLPGQAGINTVVQNTSGNWNTAYNISTNYSSVSSMFATNTTVNTLSSLLTLTTTTNNLTSLLVKTTDLNTLSSTLLTRTDANTLSSLLTLTTTTKTLTGLLVKTTDFNTLSTTLLTRTDANTLSSLLTPITVTNNLTGLLVKTTDLSTLSSTLLTRTDANTLSSLLTPITVTNNLTGLLVKTTDLNTLSGSLLTRTDANTLSSLLTPSTVTNNLTSLLVKVTDFNTLSGSLLTRTDANTLSSLLVTNTALSNLSGNWQTTYSTVCALSSNWNTSYSKVSANNLYLNANTTALSALSTYLIVQTISAASYIGVPSSGGGLATGAYLPLSGGQLTGLVTSTSSVSTVGTVYAFGGNSSQWNTAYSITTAYPSTSSSFVTNTTVNTLTSTLLPTTIYQNASGNWQTAYNNAIYTVNGTSNQIVASPVGNNTGSNSVTLSLPNNVNINTLNVLSTLNVAGSANFYSTTNLNVSSNIIYFGEGNTANALDLGIVSHFTGNLYNDGIKYQHTGLVRKAGQNSPGVWTLFSGLTSEPGTTNSGINWNDPTLQVDTLSANLIGNVTGNASTVTNGVYSNTAIVPAPSNNITNIVSMTVANYNNITPNSNTLYILV